MKEANANIRLDWMFMDAVARMIANIAMLRVCCHSEAYGSQKIRALPISEKLREKLNN